ncbi:MAG: class I SAM-dependent methyltransferase [Lacrimispora celerecrescens]|nr:class I SAM-dependent methyltransferase [Lacrimispora celerecrescens]
MGYESTKKKGLNVINSYFNDLLGLKNITVFAAMMVFEHFEAPLDVLKAAFASLEEGGVGLINVPNGQLIL